jgi:hypothetical protein
VLAQQKKLKRLRDIQQEVDATKYLHNYHLNEMIKE